MSSSAFRLIPRQQWPDHPHWPHQTLLLGSHHNFRFISERLIEAAQTGENLEWLEYMVPRWIAAMRSHEAYEEYKLYPYLTRRWGLSFGEAEAGHQRLHERGAAVREAMEGLVHDQPAPALAAALQAHDAVLREHLAHEEELVIPALLQLEPEEFERYRVLRLPELLAQLDTLDATG